MSGVFLYRLLEIDFFFNFVLTFIFLVLIFTEDKLFGENVMESGMVEIPMNKLLEICREIHEAGGVGSAELRDSAIEEVLIRHGISLADNWKVYTAKELSEMPVDSVFIHSVHGRCWISQRPDGQAKFMSFVKCGPVDFRNNSHPWDKPMKFIG